jgi:hypothetical protein
LADWRTWNRPPLNSTLWTSRFLPSALVSATVPLVASMTEAGTFAPAVKVELLPSAVRDLHAAGGRADRDGLPEHRHLARLHGLDRRGAVPLALVLLCRVAVVGLVLDGRGSGGGEGGVGTGDGGVARAEHDAEVVGGRRGQAVDRGNRARAAARERAGLAAAVKP